MSDEFVPQAGSLGLPFLTSKRRIRAAAAAMQATSVNAAMSTVVKLISNSLELMILPLALCHQLCVTSQSVWFTNATLDNSQMDETRPSMKTPARGRGLTLP